MEVRGQLWSSVLSFHWVGPGDLTHLLKLRGISLALCHLFFYVGIQTKASCMIDKCSTIELHSQSLML